MGYIRTAKQVRFWCPICMYGENLWFVPIEFGNVETFTYYLASNKPKGWNYKL